MSEHFDREWLGLREPVDHAARPASLADALAEWVVRVRGANEAPLRVLDLGAGSGSNLRWLAPRLPDPQLWTLVDHDASLLDAARRDAGGERVEHLRVEDFAAAPPALPGAAPAPLLVTGAALLDLVSARWLDALVAACAARGAAVLFALSYDGRIEWSQPDPEDAALLAAVNRHQGTDKGFGPALGPGAAMHLERALERHGYRVEAAASPWELDAARPALVRALIDGWAEAAAAMEPTRAGDFRAWAGRRRAAVIGDGCRLRVGHRDVLGLPPAPGRGSGSGVAAG
ncbi:class I SAM-dependent methyltransferase [Thioalkalivibrio halophilus]|uniref:SAM-dependent methyltransferase n=1 Tax=Thioalkalivibrio halophilus TaxID=252474 RepID=A0A1V3A056_9GAMM|nr:class I SAM-dependent methyltransferase [Thioalkalivibrio halophilus]OOC10734.1 SAM-dependent methyltransferase [Thioalkalivibrio halophilus]